MKTINVLMVRIRIDELNPDHNMRHLMESGVSLGTYFIPGKVEGSFSGTNLGMLAKNVEEGYKVVIRNATKTERKQIINWYK